ncbi:MAG: TAXI family TRAP transporter solute-binding subunit [Atribacterota bacterium]|nr:TAXI family TRAP transporter solute-binding subunit [Atribacterota bacterium]MDD4895707.1 TAXI family TRAP transporter solute-binding subunit [Atribacterota bacterium]MDD5636502.1 TAXI family TRAP transporter solute-binding subunit [Atribacterota bacterium]
MIKIYRILVAILFFSIIFSQISFAQEEITIAGGSVGGSWFPIVNAISDLLNQELGKNIFFAKPGGGSSNPLLVSQGKMSAGMSYSSFLVALERGEDPFTIEHKNNNLRSVALLFPMYYHIIAAKELPFDSLGEFVEMKHPVRIFPTDVGHAENWITVKALAALGVTLDDINKWGGQVKYISSVEEASEYKDKHINMAVTHNVIPFATFIDMFMSRDSKLIGLDEIVIKELKEYGMQELVIPAGTYEGQDKDIKTVGMPAVLFVRDDIPDDIVYAMAKVICENTEYLSSINKSFNSFNPETAWANLGATLHPGAEKYFKEKGYMK